MYIYTHTYTCIHIHICTFTHTRSRHRCMDVLQQQCVFENVCISQDQFDDLSLHYFEVCVCVCVYVCLCLCVKKRERENERECVCVCMTTCLSITSRCVFLCVCLSVSVYACETFSPVRDKGEGQVKILKRQLATKFTLQNDHKDHFYQGALDLEEERGRGISHFKNSQKSLHC